MLQTFMNYGNVTSVMKAQQEWKALISFEKLFFLQLKTNAPRRG